MHVDSVIDSVIAYISDPVQFGYLKNIFLVFVGCFLLAGLFRLISGKNESAVKSVAAILGVLILYCLRVALAHWDTPLHIYFAQLPFAQIHAGSTQIFALTHLNQSGFYVELVNLLMLVLVFNLLETLLPLGSNFFVWLLLRCVSIVGTFSIYSVGQLLFSRFLPSFFTNYAPIILLALLGLFLAVTVFKWLFGIILGVAASPVIGGIYTFFISTILGKQLSKAALTTAGLFSLVYFCQHYGITVIDIGDLAGVGLTLIISIALGIWFVIGKVF